MNIYFPNVISSKGWNTSYKNSKPIISFGESPVISYNPFHNYLEVKFKMKYTSNNQKNIYYKLENIPNASWLELVIVIEGKKLKIYLNRKLEKYIQLINIPILQFSANHKIKFGEYRNNFNGMVKKITFYKNALTTKEIQEKIFNFFKLCF